MIAEAADLPIVAVELLPLALLGAVLGLDVVSFPQAMLSRPIVAATLGGAMVGDVTSGLLAGVVLELFALETLPVGASRYPEWGSASVVGGALFAALPASDAGALVPAVIAALLTGYVGGWSMILLRRLNGRWAKARLSSLAAGDRDAVVGLQIRGLTADLLRGALLTALALLAFRPVVRWVAASWHLEGGISKAVLLGAAAAVAGNAVWRIFHGTAGVRWYFVGGLAAGILAVLTL